MLQNLTPDVEEFRNEVRDFLDRNLDDDLRHAAAYSTGVFAEPDIGLRWQRILDEKGWLTYCWPPENGGTGWSPIKRYIFESECALAGAPDIAGMGLRLLGPVLCAFGTKEQKERFLPGIRSGEDYWCQGFSEPGSGSDLASATTSAVLRDGQYVINGSKIWTTHAQFANWIFCLVRTDKAGRKQAGLSFLLVPMDQPGVRVSPILSMSGDHEVNQVFFDDAVADAGYLIGEEGGGWAITKFLLVNERAGSCFAPGLLRNTGIAEQAFGELQSDGAVSPDRLLSLKQRLEAARLQVEAFEMLELELLHKVQAGQEPGPSASLIKLAASTLMQKIDEICVDLVPLEGRALFDSNSHTKTYPVRSPIDYLSQVGMSKYLNNRAATIYGGSTEIMKNILANEILH